MSEKLVKEMTMYQQSLCDSLAHENERYDDFKQQINLDELITNLDRSCSKLRRLQADMKSFSERSKNLRQRAEKLQDAKQSEDERFAFELDRVKQMEQTLKPVVVAAPTSNNQSS